MGIILELNFTGALGAAAIRRKKQRMALVLQEQVLDRIHSSGDDEITFTPLDFNRPSGGKSKPLFDTGQHLAASITNGFDSESVWVGSNFIGARLHQLGTVGKGGKLPSIVPVRAQALFIPMSPLGAKSVLRIEGKGARRRKGLRRKAGQRTLVGLEKGKDFLLLQKVDIHPRPYLRLSRENRLELLEIWKEN